MSNQGDFAGRMRDNWRQRAHECTTFRAELRVIPGKLKNILWALYLAAVLVAVLTSIFAPQVLIEPLGGEPLLIRLLAMLGIVTGVAIGASVFILFYGYIWVDAKRRRMNPLLWVLVSLLVPYAIGAILYFVVREPLPLVCPQCGRKVNPHFNFCPACQFNLRPSCPQCRRGIRIRDGFCPHCGFSLQADAPSQAPAPSA